MTARKTNTLFKRKPNVAGTVHSAGALKCALRLAPGAVDFLELRVDAFAPAPEELIRAAARLRHPLIVTVRGGAEGGAGSLSAKRRRDLYSRFLPLAIAIDIELNACRSFGPIIDAAKSQGAAVILSSHNFRKTPLKRDLAKRLQRALDSGADVFKLASFASSIDDLARLLGLFSAPSPIPLSIMGMGPYGKASRLVLARAGSVLNYGYLDRPQVPGQWEAAVLKQRIHELFAES